MRRLVFTMPANRSLENLLEYLTIDCGSVVTARSIVEKIRTQCRKLAGLSVTLGRPRPELPNGLRSFPFGSQIIYIDAIEIVDILHAHRDLRGLFDQTDD